MLRSFGWHYMATPGQDHAMKTTPKIKDIISCTHCTSILGWRRAHPRVSASTATTSADQHREAHTYDTHSARYARAPKPPTRQCRPPHLHFIGQSKSHTCAWLQGWECVVPTYYPDPPPRKSQPYIQYTQSMNSIKYLNRSEQSWITGQSWTI